jgi:LysM repeat protein
MGSYNLISNSTYRNEGWGLVGSGVSAVDDALQATGDDSKYIYNPSSRGRAAIRFPQDISSSNIPDGAVITSVTVFMRVNKTDSSSRSVTVNMFSTDNTACYTTRTIQVPSTITTIEVGSYTRDPIPDHHWTKDRLNRMVLQVSSSAGTSNKVRVYELYARINYRVRPSITIQNPTGTVNTPSPVVSWTYSQADGDQQATAEYKIFSAVQQQAVSFNPDTSPALYPESATYTVKPGDTLWGIAAKKLGDATRWPDIYAASSLRSGDPDLIYPGEVVTIPSVAFIHGDITSFTLPFALAQDTYYVYIRVTSQFESRSPWTGRAFTVGNAASPGVPGGSFGGVGTGGGSGFESVIADAESSNIFLTLRDGSNLLSVQQADFETTTDSLGFVGANATLSQDTAVAYNTGSGSMKMVAASAAAMSATSSFLEIAPQTEVTARVQLQAVATARTCSLSVRFYDFAFMELNSGAGTISISGADTVGSFTELVCSGMTPDDAVYATVDIGVASPANAEQHNADDIGLMYGDGSAWSHGGHMSRNLLSSAASDADEPITDEPWVESLSSTYARVATSGNGAEGLKAFKMTYDGISPTISYVSTGAVFTDVSNGGGYTLNKPASVADGDLLVAFVATDLGGEANPPVGWTIVDYVANFQSTSLTVLMKDGLAADPSTWVSDVNETNTSRKKAVVVCYRGAAPVASQFDDENVSKSPTQGSVLSTAVVSNSDPGAWRLSAFVFRDDVTGGSLTANTLPPTGAPPIAFVGYGSNWQSTSSSNSYTINRPSGVISGDLMIAGITLSGYVSVTAPSGWTLVRTVQAHYAGLGDEHSGAITTAILKRTAGGSEPSSWTGTNGSTGQPKVTQCVAYRNADTAANQFIDEDGQYGGSSNMNTPTVTNSNSKAWRISIFGATTPYGAGSSSNEAIERVDNSTSLNNFPDASLAIYDSNGPVSTGNHSRSGYLNDSPYATASWIGIIKPITTGPSAVADETQRADSTAGTSNPWVTLGVFDSNTVATTGAQQVYGSFSGATGVSSTAWIGFLKPLAATVGGEVGCTLDGYVDITSIDQAVIDRASGHVVVQASFLGSTSGTPYLRAFFYVGNELVSTQVAEGASFNTATWTKAATSFPIPDGTTRVSLGVAAADRQVDDYVLFDRVSLALGTDTVWRRGTGRDTHPIFNVPDIQYAEDLGDGYGDWAALPGLDHALLKYDQLTGLVSFIDQMATPLSSRKYRARTVSYGLAGDIFISPYGPESQEVRLVARQWWLKDPLNPDLSMAINVKAEALDISTSNTSAIFQGLGEQYPVVLTEGYKGDQIPITVQAYREDFLKLRNLLSGGRTLFLQSDLDSAWWVRPVNDLDHSVQITGKMHEDPLRFIKLLFVQVDSVQF